MLGMLSNVPLRSIDFFYEFRWHLIVRCVAWSSQGNVIVVALLNGLFRQYRIEISSITRIRSLANLFEGPYEPIALQWLSTNQFAVVYLENSNDAQPSILFIILYHDLDAYHFHFISTFTTVLYIITARGDEQPTYVKIDNTYYGSAASQVYLLHLPQWNLILTGSRNDARINILTTDETTDTPSWMQLNFVSGR